MMLATSLVLLALASNPADVVPDKQGEASSTEEIRTEIEIIEKETHELESAQTLNMLGGAAAGALACLSCGGGTLTLLYTNVLLGAAVLALGGVWTVATVVWGWRYLDHESRIRDNTLEQKRLERRLEKRGDGRTAMAW